MVQAAGIGGGATGPWYRVLAVSAGSLGGGADRDYAAVLPAALSAAANRRPFIAGWLSRGGGAPLELITNAGPLPELAPASHPPHDGVGRLGSAHSGPRSGSNQFGSTSADPAQPGSALAGPDRPDHLRPAWTGPDRPDHLRP